MSDNPSDIFRQLNELMKQLMEQAIQEQGGQRPFAYGFKIIINEADAKQLTPQTSEAAASSNTVAPSAQPTSTGSIEPIAEVYVEDSDVTVAVDLPGVDGKKIHLSLITNTLTIVAEGNQLTSVDLPPVDGDSMKSSYKNGVLEVKLSRGKSIRID
jgi:HSP20 family protein